MNNSPYSKAYFTKNRQNIRSKIPADVPVVLSANTQVQYSADAAFPFRQDTNFWYLTGIDEPDMLYVHDGEKECLILPKSNAVRDVFDGAADIEDLRKISGIERILSYKQGSVLLKNIVKKHQHIAVQLPATGLQIRYGIAPNPARKQVVNRLRRLKAGLTFQHLGVIFAELRMVKSHEEITALKSAIDCTIAAFEKIRGDIKPKIYEYEIEAKMTSHFRSNNAKHAYSPIVAGGRRACTLHYSKNDQMIKNKDAVLIDVGAEVSRGAADISRTYSVGKPSTRLKNIHSAVLDAQDFALGLLKPGLDMREYEQEVEKQMGVYLKQLGIIKQASRKQIRKYYPHATSHFLGLDVHDIADYSRPLEPGMVLTVEPGIYVPNESIGVRVEDNIIITETGAEVLSRALPRGLC